MLARIALWSALLIAPGIEIENGQEGWAVVTMLLIFVALVMEKWYRERNNF